MSLFAELVGQAFCKFLVLGLIPAAGRNGGEGLKKCAGVLRAGALAESNEKCCGRNEGVGLSNDARELHICETSLAQQFAGEERVATAEARKQEIENRVRQNVVARQ